MDWGARPVRRSCAGTATRQVQAVHAAGGHPHGNNQAEKLDQQPHDREVLRLPEQKMTRPEALQQVRVYAQGPARVR